MSQALSPSFARCYGLARVARVWKISRAGVYRSLKETPPNTSARRPGPVGACSDAELAEQGRREKSSGLAYLMISVEQYHVASDPGRFRPSRSDDRCR